ncbi:hypothetical protein MHBO_003971 [Bonamia ostreae]|uniref:Uncharacterized protein n=1 Tax=Bonamia ostreae TaxID=126728 RepID=A0ABV2AS11_9EUKA
MRQSLIVLTQRLESEMHQNHSNAVNYRKRIEDLTSRNNMMEFNFKGLQKKIMLQTRKRETKDGAAPDGEVLEKRKRKLESTRLELDEVRKKYQRVLGENRHLKMAGDKWKHKGGAIEKPSVATLEKEIVIAKTLIEQIMVLKNHQNILCLNDSKNLDSPLIKPDITNIFQRLRKCCGQLENNLGDEKTVEMFLSRSEDDFAKETPKDGFTVSQILDKRVSPEGKTQFYVCCPVNPVLAREAVLSGAGPSPVSIEEGSDPGALCERVWVDEQSLVGCETLIEKFRSARSIEGAVETKE